MGGKKGGEGGGEGRGEGGQWGVKGIGSVPVTYHHDPGLAVAVIGGGRGEANKAAAAMGG